MGERQKRKRYTKTFKLDVIRQSYERENISELASELDLHPGLIYKWRAAYESEGSGSFPGNGKVSRTREEAELERVKAENRELRLECPKVSG